MIDTEISININAIREKFPMLRETVYGKPFIYFDNAATTQKSQEVIDTLNNYYSKQNSNIYGEVHYISQQTTIAFEKARKTIQCFINAAKPYEIIFTKGATDSINLVASSFGKKYIKEGDEIIISTMEHHSNIVPWQIVCEERQAILKVIPINDKGEIVVSDFEKLLSKKTRIVAITHVSNAIGTINPIKQIIAKAHEYNIPVLIDGAQAIPHLHVDVQHLDCDFYCFSGHKVYGPMGIGILYGKERFLEELPPYQSGGEMVKKVSFEKSTYNELPYKFEAGSDNVANVIGLEAAFKYLTKIGLNNIISYESQLITYATNKLSEIDGLNIIGTADDKICIISFIIEDVHPYDTGVILDRFGIAVRTGHHCTQPLMDRFNITGTVRASLAFYNTKQEINEFIKSILKIKEMFS